MSRRGRVLAALTLVVLGSSACVVSTSTRPRTLTLTEGDYGIHGAVKAHLVDGSIVAFPRGARVAERSLLGEGERFGPALAPMGPTTRVPLDSLRGVVAYTREVNRVRTTLYVGAQVAAASALAVFGFFIALFSAFPPA